MTAQFNDMTEKTRFYTALQVAQIAWVGIALALGGAFAIASLPLYVITLTGMLVILGLAMRHPTYVRIRQELGKSSD